MKEEIIGRRLRELRGNETQAQIAEKLGITKSSWAMYETGRRVPRDQVKVRIAKHFGRLVQEIFFDGIEH